MALFLARVCGSSFSCVCFLAEIYTLICSILMDLRGFTEFSLIFRVRFMIRSSLLHRLRFCHFHFSVLVFAFLRKPRVRSVVICWI